MAYFDKFKDLNNNEYKVKEGINRLVTCSTAANVAAKVIDLSYIETNYSLVNGDLFFVKFTNGNSITSGVNLYNKSVNNMIECNANSIIPFIFNGTSWDVYGGITNNEKYSIIGVGQNLVVNINGQQFAGYKFSEDKTQGVYRYREFQVNSTSQKVTDVSVIKNYLSFMFGNRVLPEFYATKPYLCIFITTDSNNIVYKMQYSPSDGLRAYYVDNFPLATKKDIPTFTVENSILIIN